MPGKIGIVGVGQVGAAAAYMLSRTPGIREVVLVDLDRARAEGEAADIAHAAAFGGVAEVRAGDYADLAGADAVVISAGASLKPGQTRLELLTRNVRITAAIIPEVRRAAPDAIQLFATNPVDVMPAIAVKRFGIDPRRAIATGCALDSVRFRDRLARHFDVAPTALHAYVLGEHGDSEVLHWSGAHAASMPLERFAVLTGRPLPPELRAGIAEEVRTSAYRIKQGKGVSNYGIGGCVARLAQAVAGDEHTIFSVATFMPELLGVRDTCVSLPHVLGRQGSSAPLLPPLDAGEEEALRRSAAILAEAIDRGLASLD
ncbi:L-lactate dehydrogenase [Roseomonas sp. NAR14]|uniref:L-lactate dehydrogenase n=1 Tax=Roseomonas acroporae TaxID=2937791 RepID=A0A9X1Y9C7_9PROT|nr:L-lactate dehydrogenase [Roseomonas acroporae]MCK8785482.1 L-lactate dehydrogenase [Roseomonas acroporae]